MAKTINDLTKRRPSIPRAEAPPRVEQASSDAEALFKEAKQRERRRLAVAGAVVLASGIGASVYAAIGSGGGTADGRSSLTSSGPTIGPPGPRAWSQARVVTALLADQPVALPATPYAYAIEVTSTSPTSPEGRLVRIDLTTSHLTDGPRLPAASELFDVGLSLGVLSPSGLAKNGARIPPFRLRLVRGATTLTSGVIVPAPGIAAPATRNPVAVLRGIWLPTKRGVALVDVDTGAVTRTVRFPVPVTSVSVDPSGRLLYVALDELIAHPDNGTPSTVIAELDARTGAVLARTGIDFTLGSASLTAVRGGVWVSYRGGMMGTAVLYRAAGLRLVQPAKASRQRQPAIPTMGSSVTMGIDASSVGTEIWLNAATGASCVTPSSGEFQAGTTFAEGKGGVILGWSPFASWNGLLYGSRLQPPYNATQVVAIRPTTTCASVEPKTR